MPTIITRGAESASAFGFGAQASTSATYIEDVFSTYLYTGTGYPNIINNKINLASTGTGWSYTNFTQLQFAGNQYTGAPIVGDSSGNIYVSGRGYDGTNYYASISKINSGSIVWQRKFYQGTSVGAGINVDSSGNVYVTGIAKISTTQYMFVAKYNSSGVLQWQRYLKDGTVSYTQGQGIVVDSSGNVYAVGVLQDSSVPGLATVVVKYNSSGTIQWQKYIQTGNGANAGIAIDSSGNIYITGQQNNRMFIIKMTSSGSVTWQRDLYGSGNVGSGYGITVDSSGNVYVAGLVYTTYYLGIVAKYNSSGTIQWQRYLDISGVNPYGNPISISVDSSSNVYVSGIWAGDSSSSNNYVGAIIKYNSSGVLQWNYTISPTVSGTTNAITSLGSYTDSTNFYFSTTLNYNGNYSDTLFNVPVSGNLVSGTVGNLLLSGSIIKDSSGSATDTSSTAFVISGTATDQAGTATDAAGTDTLVNGTVTVTSSGGLVWIKDRTSAYNHNLFDTTQGATKYIHSNTTDATGTDSVSLTSFNANGFSLGTGNTSGSQVNTSANNFVSWTFRKQAKFFDIVTYTGNGVAGRQIAHNLGSTPGCIIIKCTSDTYAWKVYHTSLGAGVDLQLNDALAAAANGIFPNVPTSTAFTIADYASVNASGQTYVAYLFASNAGGFGVDGTQNVITCGSYTGTGAAGNVINIGYEPQWILIKNTVTSANWILVDNFRGMPNTTGLSTNTLSPNLINAETQILNGVYPYAMGFTLGSGYTPTNNSGDKFIYIAIRRSPMKTPTVGTSVFSPVVRTGTGANTTISTNFVADSYWSDSTSAGWYPVAFDRLRGYSGTELAFNISQGEQTACTDAVTFMSNNSVSLGADSTSGLGPCVNANATSYVNWILGRAPSFFDTVCYSGNISAQTIAHNLTVVPQLMFVKSRSSASSYDWAVYSAFTGNGNYLYLDSNIASTASSSIWNSTTPTANNFYVGNNNTTNNSSFTYVAYLFSTCPGVSSVGNYTGNGTTQTINCGFTGGARFVLIKRTDTTGNWYIYDTARGMTATTDPYLLFNGYGTQTATLGSVKTVSTGFSLDASVLAAINTNGGTYIYLAIA